MSMPFDVFVNVLNFIILELTLIVSTLFVNLANVCLKILGKLPLSFLVYVAPVPPTLKSIPFFRVTDFTHVDKPLYFKISI